jgi:hypothetical protein
MSRQRSPSYPAISIDQAIDFVSRIHKSCRANVIDRETAAREMGYNGLTGRSMKVLSDLIQFNLLEKEGKGNVKVSQLGVDVLHGIDPDDRQQAKLEAALSPQLFRDIHERFPDGIPSETAIRSFLIQQDFMDTAIGPAINAFLETIRAVEDIRENEERQQLVEDAGPIPSGGTIYTSSDRISLLPSLPISGHSSFSMVGDLERVVFSEETGTNQHLKLIVAGDMSLDLLEALEDFIKRQKKRLQSPQNSYREE